MHESNGDVGMMKTIMREQDLICGTDKKAEEIYCFPGFPINMLSDSDCPNEDPVMDMRIGINRKTGFIQLMQIPSPDDLYNDAHFNATGEVWAGLHRKMADILRRAAPEHVLEVGGGIGMLEVIYNSTNPTTRSWKIIEPVVHPLQECKAEYIKGFFPEAVPVDERFDVLVHSHVMEHAKSPRDFIRDIAGLPNNSGRMVFAVPNMKRNMQEMVTSVINFEHSIFLTEDYIEYLLDEFGFSIECKEYYLDHSIIYSVRKKDMASSSAMIDFSTLYKDNLDIFRRYVVWHEEKMKILNNKMESENRPIYLFGGHITTQFYLAFGLNTAKIRCVLDNDKAKHGRRVAGTAFHIFSPSVIEEESEVVVILPQSPYAKEIKEGMKKLSTKIEYWE